MSDVRIDVARIRQTVPAHAPGLNVNFLADHADQRQRGQGYLRALRQMGVRSLRYPGGEKSNEYFWSRPPWTAPRPSLSLTGSEGRLVRQSGLVSEDGEFRVQAMDFDEFIAMCRELGAEPIVCLGLGSAYVQNRPGLLTGSTRAQVIENAVEWLRYSNRVRGYGVRVWEIGNESFWRGSVAALCAADYARDVHELAQAMRAIDPDIRIGANGPVEKDYVSTADGADGPIWWQHLLTHAAADIDFLVVHPYPCFEWGSYEHYQTHAPVFTEAIDQATAALESWAPPSDGWRIQVMATETNAFDWAATDWYQGNAAGWIWRNDLGHALVLFDIVGQHLAHPRLAGVQVWTTRWFGAPSKLEDVLDDQNGLLPTGQALGLWGRHLQSHLTALPDTTVGAAYASYSPETQALAVFLVNKQSHSENVALQLHGYPSHWKAHATVLAGEGPQDERPVLRSAGIWEAPGADLRLELPPVSISVLAFEGLR